jgi:hypothetical protein
MPIDSNLLSALVGAGAVLIPAAGAFLIGSGSIHATVQGLAMRLSDAEFELSALDQIRADVSYIRGVLDGEARAAREWGMVQ